jgi:hypothetical protein
MPHVCSSHGPMVPSTTELGQPPGHDLSDELRAVIGMKAENREGDLGGGEPWSREPASEPSEAQGSLPSP